MDILIIGGFLGSGKTSLIKLLIRGLVKSGQTCALIENEIGEIGIDDAIIDEAKLDITPLFGGCVCCEISGNLIAAIDRIQKEINPDWVIVEMTGLALMDGIRDLFHKYSKSTLHVHTVSLVDMSRWRHLTTGLAYIFDRQVAGADIVLLNKTDIMQPSEEIFAQLAGKAPGAIITSLTPEIKQEDKLWPQLLAWLNQHQQKED